MGFETTNCVLCITLTIEIQNTSTGGNANIQYSMFLEHSIFFSNNTNHVYTGAIPVSFVFLLIVYKILYLVASNEKVQAAGF